MTIFRPTYAKVRELLLANTYAGPTEKHDAEVEVDEFLAPLRTPSINLGIIPISEKIQLILGELEQIAIDAEDIEWIGVKQKIHEAFGPLTSAREIAIQRSEEFI